MAISGTMNITNSIIASHTTAISRTAGLINENYNLFYNNGTNLVGTANSGGHSLSGFNPLFANPMADDYHLSEGNAAIDQGVSSSINDDFDNDPRPQGNGPDMGYDETAFSATVDVQVSKQASANTVVPGQTITYTLSFSNNSLYPAFGVVLRDDVPLNITNVSVSNSGVNITPTIGYTYVWDAGDLLADTGGLITITGQVSQALPGGTAITNTVFITTTALDSNASNDQSEVVLTVLSVPPVLSWQPHHHRNLRTDLYRHRHRHKWRQLDL